MSRSVLAYPLLTYGPVRSDGLGAMTGKPTDNDVWLTIGTGAALAFVFLLGKSFFAALLAPIAAMAAAWFASRWIAERIGGYTGDTLGATEQKAELVFLVVAALLIPR
jgi:adenosylcobinamide-GDP ribazoletransferase